MALVKFIDGIFESTEDDSHIRENVANYRSVGEFMLKSLDSRDPDDDIWIDGETHESWKAAQVARSIRNVAAALLDLYEIQPGDVLLISDSQASVLHCILACGIICAGGAPIYVGHDTTDDELIAQLLQVEPKIYATAKIASHRVKLIESVLKYPISVIQLDGQQESNGNNLQSLMSYDHGKSKNCSKVPYICQDKTKEVAIVILSSGTTGLPKPVATSHCNMLVELSYSPTVRRLSKSDKVLNTVTLDYASGRVISMMPFGLERAVIFMKSFEPVAYLKMIEKYKIPVICLGYCSFLDLIKQPDIGNYDLSSVRFLFPMGGKITYADELKHFCSLLPNLLMLRQGLGASEMIHISGRRDTKESFFQDMQHCGSLTPGVRVKIVDSETGKLLSFGQSGSIRAKSLGTFPGYYDKSYARKLNNIPPPPHPFPADLNKLRSDETIFDEDGFYITGDLGYMTEQGNLVVEGRLSQRICAKGALKVMPFELEHYALQHPAVKNVCVFGVPLSKELYSGIRAYVVLRAEIYDQLTGNDTHIPPKEYLITKGKEINGLPPAEQLKFKGTSRLCSLAEGIRRALIEDIYRFLFMKIHADKCWTSGLAALDEIPTLRRTGKPDLRYLKGLTSEQVEIYGDIYGEF